MAHRRNTDQQQWLTRGTPWIRYFLENGEYENERDVESWDEEGSETVTNDWS